MSSASCLIPLLLGRCSFLIRYPDACPAVYSTGKGLLSLCFIDPFSAELDFGVIKELGQAFYIDFLILLMSAVDIRQNFQRYLDDKSDTRIAKLLDDPEWRGDWHRRARRNEDLVPFLLEKFDAAMVRLGYPATTADERKPVWAPASQERWEQRA